jgi:hypothetical protein
MPLCPTGAGLHSENRVDQGKDVKAKQGDPIACHCGTVGQFVDSTRCAGKSEALQNRATDGVHPDLRTAQWLCKDCGKVVVKPAWMIGGYGPEQLGSGKGDSEMSG